MSNISTVKSNLNLGIQALTHICETPKLDAKILFRHISQLSDVDLILKADDSIGLKMAQSYKNIIRKRAKGIPVSYLTGSKEFWSLNLKVTPEVLIPRPETELLVETALTLIPVDEDVKIAELGTGSGAISLAIASERPCANIIATDISRAALLVAEENAQTHHTDNITFTRSYWFDNLADQQFDLIISNPPYVDQFDPHLKLGGVEYEPITALVSGDSGLYDLKQIIAKSANHLSQQGWILVEHGYDQAEKIRDLFFTNSWAKTQNLSDLNGLPRVMIAQRAN